MEYIYGIWAFLGFLAFLQVSSLSTKQKRMERRENDDSQVRSSMKDDMKMILTPYVGKEVIFDFYEDEEDLDMVNTNKNKFILLDVDEKWALIRIESTRKTVNKLIRISSVKGVSFNG
ncbi:hypothetical protein C8E03_104205 [Lachnotalea glycerini]|jgi:hypothetical protein|uniref:Uncharacterized protein n=1 Tax=Lachnotalea glycerini TaxID=1763509 RepID=A0A255I8I6_9FIRM|nr:hypothetical protein [Lachnotalea glycerini]PXV91197.1 hypothetical protein C8E03_104205 [Lachnotalea glycerini]RDY31642.1 hypothetical protein CG710_008590 [Lachnotalea glycerini]